MSLKLLFEIDWLKTLRFNLHYFPLKQAVRIPAYVFWHTSFVEMGGSIHLNCPVQTGMMRIGPHTIGIKDRKTRTLWQVRGGVEIDGSIHLGRGCRICVEEKALLKIGDHLHVTGETTIVCKQSITFGNDCLLSWDVMVMDTDFHHILSNGKEVNEPRPITIGNHVWIGMGTTILKGVRICDDVVVSANSNITKNLEESKCVYGGVGRGVEILKRNIDWKR